MTTPEQRENSRLRAERWRRAPWLAEGISRSPWYRRGGRINETISDLKSNTLLDLTRAESLAAALARDLARCVAIHAKMSAILA
jgi:hypothetical protein